MTKKFKRVCIIPAAGLGQRLMPLTTNKSKAMLDLNGKPIICNILETVIPYVDEVRIVSRFNDIEDFVKSRKFSVPIKFYKQEQATGPLDGIACAIEDEDLTADGDLLIWLSDTIMRHFEMPAIENEVAVWTSKVPDFKRWCLLGSDGLLYDKPVVDPKTRDALIGIYYLKSLSTAAKYIVNRTGCEISNLLGRYKCIEGINTDMWLDTGEIETLLDTRGKILDVRCDNTLEVDAINGVVRKSGKRVRNEAAWYKEIMSDLGIYKYTPRIFNLGDDFVEMEYVNAKPVQQMFIYDQCSEGILRFILKTVVDRYNKSFRSDDSEEVDNTYMFLTKPVERLKEILETCGDVVPEDEVNKVLAYVTSDEYKNQVKMYSNKRQLIHGDYHFGNILYDLNSNKMWMIDPRGNWDGKETAKGDPSYDYAKLYQSCICYYMWIVNKSQVDVEKAKQIESILDEMFGDRSTYYKITSAILQLTCVPLHGDSKSRQALLWKYAYQAFERLTGGK